MRVELLVHRNQTKENNAGIVLLFSKFPEFWIACTPSPEVNTHNNYQKLSWRNCILSNLILASYKLENAFLHRKTTVDFAPLHFIRKGSLKGRVLKRGMITARKSSKNVCLSFNMLFMELHHYSVYKRRKKHILLPPTVYHNNMIAQTNATISFTSRISVPQSLPSFQPTSPDRGLLVAAGLQDLCLCPCPIPQPLAGRPMWRLPPPGLLSAPLGCSYLKRASPVWRHAIQPVLSVSLLSSASLTTRRLCAGKSA